MKSTENSAGNVRGELAEDANDNLILMDMDNEGPSVVISDLGNTPGPLTSGDNVNLMAEILDEESGFDGCYADLYIYDDEELVDTGIDISGNELDWNLCEINGIIPDGLESGNYELRVNARDELFNTGFTWAFLIVDNTRPTMGIIHPATGEIYGKMLPMSLLIEDSQSSIADETVQARVQELPGLGNLWCLGGLICEDTGWLPLSYFGDDLYTEMINLSALGISGEGRYNFDALACDDLYFEDEDLDNPLGVDMNEDRNTRHCKMISEHGASEEERYDCNDGIDNDGDGDIDSQDDSGCESFEDDDESDEE